MVTFRLNYVLSRPKLNLVSISVSRTSLPSTRLEWQRSELVCMVPELAVPTI